MLNEDTEKVNVLTENLENVDAESIRKATSYLIDQKSFEFADRLVKHLKDEGLAEELSQAKKADLTQRIDKVNEEIDSLTKEQADSVDAGKKLQSELDKIKEDDKKARDKKQNQIKDNKSKQDELTKSLAEKQEELEELKNKCKILKKRFTY